MFLSLPMAGGLAGQHPSVNGATGAMRGLCPPTWFARSTRAVAP